MNLMISMLTVSLCLTLSPNISPINMAFMIIIMIILSAIIIAHFKTWLSLILTLIFLGGMMIIVLYITKMTKKNFYQEKMKITMPLLISTILIINTLLTNSQPSTPNFHNIFTEVNQPNLELLLPNQPLLPLILFTMTFLLLVLILLVKMMSTSNTPLRIF
uniref:NADH dehydrogenase subunit 6 n=1 Tax=Tachaea chinensis TaxID=1862870 RepID=A0A7L4XRB4_9CRUS|nr:NADH dehydrogenase subunit 6 [Tachaea chinensis]